jgi:hypothetical protein
VEKGYETGPSRLIEIFEARDQSGSLGLETKGVMHHGQAEFP